MSEPALDAIHSALGQILREMASLGTGQTELHVKVDQVIRAVKRVADDQVSVRFDVDRALRRLARAERQIETLSEKPDVPDWRPDPREITGTHDFALIKSQHEEMMRAKRAEEERRIDSGIWRRRQTTVWLVSAIGAVALLVLGGCVTYAVSRLPAAISAPVTK